MSLRLPIFSGILLLSCASLVQAQILFQPAVAITTTDGSQISTRGTYVDAVGANGFSDSSLANPGAAITIGDTTFNPVFSDSGITVNNAGGGTDGSHSTATPFETVLDDVVYTGDFNPADTNAATFSLNNLKVGDAYQVQVFNVGGFQTVVSGINTVPISNSYTLGDFVATTTSESFTFGNYGTAQGGTSGIGAIGAVSLRDVTSVPESSTYALIGLGLISLLVFGKVRKLTV